MDTLLDASPTEHTIAVIILVILAGIYWYITKSANMQEFRDNVLYYKNKVLVNTFVKRDGMVLATKEPSWFVSLLEFYGLV
jgi:hypothetical protein|uniref:Uncharacterized protein n=1 Tax=viral metagenome TaxID=1070528 RepID=A0A6C0KHE5_9ZZZZ